MEITIDEEFKSLIPPPTDLERAQLEDNLHLEGCRDPLVVWKGTGILVDGHNRYVICEREGIAYNAHEIGFESREKAIDWICCSQLGRRNLSPDVASELRGRIYNGRKKTKAEAGAKGGTSKAQNETCLESTAKIVAKQTGVSAATIKRDGQYADALDKLAEIAPDVRKNTRAGKVSKGKVIAAAKNPEKAKEILAGKKPAAEESASASQASIILDSLDVPVPSEFREAHELGKTLMSAGRDIDKFRKLAKDLSDKPGGEWIRLQDIDEHVRALKGHFQQAKYHTLCPVCKGKRTGCKKCNGVGFLPDYRKGTI